MSEHDLPHDAQGVIDAVLNCAKLLGIPGLTLGAKAAELLIDLGFEYFFHKAAERLHEAEAAKAAGNAASAASIATHAVEAYKRRESAASTDPDGLLEPSFPLADRTDLPQHEREISDESLAALQRGIAEVRAGEVVTLPLDAFEPDEEGSACYCEHMLDPLCTHGQP